MAALKILVKPIDNNKNTCRIKVHYIFNKDSKYNKVNYSSSRIPLYNNVVNAVQKYIGKLETGADTDNYVLIGSDNNWLYEFEIVLYTKYTTKPVLDKDGNQQKDDNTKELLYTYPLTELLTELFTLNDMVLIECTSYSDDNIDSYITYDSQNIKVDDIENIL